MHGGSYWKVFKGIVHPKIKILPLITHPRVVPNLQDLSSSEHKLRLFWWNPRTFCPSINSNASTTFKTQKGSKDINKIVHVTSGVQPCVHSSCKQGSAHTGFTSERRLCVSNNTRMRHDTEFTSTDIEEKKLFNKTLFLFSLQTKSILVFSSNEGWTTDVIWTILMMSLLPFWVLN